MKRVPLYALFIVLLAAAPSTRPASPRASDERIWKLPAHITYQEMPFGSFNERDTRYPFPIWMLTDEQCDYIEARAKEHLANLPSIGTITNLDGTIPDLLKSGTISSMVSPVLTTQPTTGEAKP
jgi:hypothetical protein